MALGSVVPLRRRPLVSNGVLGMLVFVLTEIMLFAGFISAFSIVKASAAIWPPPGQVRLPVEATAFNTLALLASGVALYFAGRAFPGNPQRTSRFLLAALGLGGFFVLFQGAEWVTLIAQGLTLRTSAHASFFYVIVGAHALHAIAAILALGYFWFRLRRGDLRPPQLHAVQVFWYFVVGVWPVLYLQVYL